MQEGNEQVRERLDQLIRQHGASFAELSRHIGRNSAYVQQFIRRGVPRRLSEQDRRRLARYFRITEQELGGPAVNISEHRAGSDAGNDHAIVQPGTSCHEVTGPQGISVVVVPFLDRSPLHHGDSRWASAGFVLDAELANQISNGRPTIIGAIIADGDSMAPGIASGDYLLYDSSQKTADRDGLYVIQGSHAPMIRRIAVDPVAATVHIIADNPLYPRTTISDPESIPIVGRILWTGKPIG